MSLDNNQLSELPIEIGQLANSEQLSLNNNRLRELPAEIGQLTNLQCLVIDNGQLSESQIQELGLLSDCRVIVW